jgi:hypothetical protein
MFVIAGVTGRQRDGHDHLLVVSTAFARSTFESGRSAGTVS